MNTPKIIFFDIDDTLYRKYTDTLRPSVAKAMEALKARGILTAIATGRPPVAIPGKVKTLIRDSGIDMLVTINGQYTTFHGEVLQAYPMIEAEVERMCAFFDSQYIDYAFVNDAEIVASAAGERVKEALSHILPAFEVDKEYFRKQSVYQMLVFADDAQEQEIQIRALARVCAGHAAPRRFKSKRHCTCSRKVGHRHGRCYGFRRQL